MQTFDRTREYFKVIRGDNVSHCDSHCASYCANYTSYFGNYKYKEGLNTLEGNGETFNTESICGPGGLYFSDIKHIFNHIGHGTYMCTLHIPDDAQVVKVGNKYKADKIYIKKIEPITIELIRCLVEDGAELVYQYVLWKWAADNNCPELIRFMIKNASGPHRQFGGLALISAAGNGNLQMVKFLIELGADGSIGTKNNYSISSAIWKAHAGNYTEVVNYLEICRENLNKMRACKHS